MKIRALLPFLALSLSTARAEDAGFVSMFDGKTLAGWEAMPAKTAPAWTVRDGVIHGDGDQGKGYLVWKDREVGNFEMKLSYRFPGGKKANSGISLRAIVDKTKRRGFQSYHADLGNVGIGPQVLGAWDFHTPGRKEHRCFRGERLVIGENDQPTLTRIEDAVTLKDIKKGDWNAVHIIARDNHFKLYINGRLSSEFTEHLPMEKRLLKGMIQLQLHDPGMIAEFKDLRIKVLD